MNRTYLLLGLAALLFIFRKQLTERLTMTAESITSYTDPLRRQIVREEGLKRYAYLDQAGKWTIGIGHKIKPNESHLMNYTQSNPAPDAVIDALYDSDIADAAGTVKTAVKVPLSANQYAALVSLVFNIGIGAFLKSTLLQKINAGDVQGAAEEILKWRYATINGVKEPVLLARRQREKDLFMTA